MPRFAAGGMQMAESRLTDFVRFGWVCDVFVLPEYRGLATDDAHDLYKQYGFRKPVHQRKLLMRGLDMGAVEKSYGL
ncbi:hypothetical protein [Bacillus swezeyi]|uniref:GNAT family N-acetyltransferase n=2 Tax=Bacillus swezeyi TaxID=1925020 RepID=A0A5M8RW36_9BACI|nr:hypothetical protein [Bacillus swezeyi]KAA6451054.1 hypothetical protein DX927_09530 [Bacillus swezeyi]KAA6474815.1 hypothetical protein DX928_12310 [Bacillus swezeyi]